jgi:hypothetical protein
MLPSKVGLRVRTANGGQVTELESDHWKLSLPPGEAGSYRWAQLDDYLEKQRKDFFWTPPCRLEITARVSGNDLPGTWGFGFWNDPFTASLGIRGVGNRLPTLPNTAWFFFASSPNYLAFRDDHPAQGMLAATFRSMGMPVFLQLVGLAVAPGLYIPSVARRIRKMARKWIAESGAGLDLDPTFWHTYVLEWQSKNVVFKVDENKVFSTQIAPEGRLGCVIWIDNQFAALPPDGRVGFGTLANPDMWLEIRKIRIQVGNARAE